MAKNRSLSMRYLSQSMLSELTGLDRRTVRARLEGVEPYEEHAQAIIYDTHVVLPILFKAVTSTDVDKSYKADEARKMKADADIKELEAAKRKAELIDLADVIEVVEAEYNAIRAKLIAIPTNVCQEVAMSTDEAEVKAILEDAVNEVLTELTADLGYNVEFNKYEPTYDERERSPNQEAMGTSDQDVKTKAETESG